MAYVTIPKDLNNVKTKFMGNFTKRQCVCFGLGILTGFPVYFLVKSVTDSTVAFYALLIVLAPFLLLGMVEKNGMPLEKYMKYYLLHKIINPSIRKMKMENIYEDYALATAVKKEMKGENNGTADKKYKLTKNKKD